MTTTIRGLPILDIPMDFPRPMPDGDTCENYVLQLVPGANGVPVAVAFKPVHILIGTSALYRNLPLVGRATTPLWDLGDPVGNQEFDQYGMRGGLTAYVPPGVYKITGVLVVACPACTEVNVVVKQGHLPSSDPLRPNIVSEYPEQVGSGGDTTAGEDYRPCSIKFAATSVQFDGAPGMANEISVHAYLKNDLGGAALGVLAPDSGGGGGAPSNMVSWLLAERVR